MRRKLIRKYQAFNQDFQRSKELFLKWFIPEIKKRFLGVKRINYKDISRIYRSGKFFLYETKETAPLLQNCFFWPFGKYVV